MMKRFKKGNALLTTTIIMFAISFIAASLTSYFYYASIQTNNQNLYAQKHVELENEFNKNYELILKNVLVDIDNSDEQKNLNTQITTLGNGQVFSFSKNGYKSKVERIDDVDEFTKAFKYSIETSHEFKSGRVREYKLVKTLTLSSTLEYILLPLEGYHVTSI